MTDYEYYRNHLNNINSTHLKLGLKGQLI